MIGFGLLHLIVPLLSSTFGVLLIVAGIVTAIFTHKNLLLLSSLVLIVAAFINMLAGSWWMWLALFQVYLAYKEYKQYRNFDERFVVDEEIATK